MDYETAYSFPWFEFISLVVTGAGMLGGVWWRLHSQITTDRETAAGEIAKIRQDNAVQFGATAAVIADFRLEVARTYATNAAIKDVEDRIVSAIDRLGDRLDKFIDNRTN